MKDLRVLTSSTLEFSKSFCRSSAVLMEARNSSLVQTCFFLETVDLTQNRNILISEILICVLNSLFSITAVSFNILVLLIIWKTPLLHSASNILICCLACSDLVIGLLAQPLLVLYKVAELKYDHKTACVGRLIHWIAGFVCGGVSVMTIATIAVDKVLALTLHLRYKLVVTEARVIKVVFAFWFFCVAAGVSLFFANSDRYWTLIPLPVLSISLTTTFASYFEVFRVLRRHQKQIRAQTRSAWTVFNMKKYKKSVFTMLYVLAMFLICYIPFLTAMAVRIMVGYNSLIKMAYEWGATVVYLNSSLNPLLYWIRMQEIRAAAYNLLRKLWGSESESKIESKVYRISALNEGISHYE